eukprot:536408-Pleurochrysis_carterae.AAC.2
MIRRARASVHARATYRRTQRGQGVSRAHLSKENMHSCAAPLRACSQRAVKCESVRGRDATASSSPGGPSPTRNGRQARCSGVSW